MIARAQAQLVLCNLLASIRGIDPVEIHFMISKRFSRCLGDALLTVADQRIGRVRLCERLEIEWPPEQVAETITHEIAHIFAALDGSQGHDDIWRHYMDLFGYPDARRLASISRKLRDANSNTFHR